MRHPFRLFAFLLLLLPLAAGAQDASPLMSYGEVYSGPKNETVDIAYFKDGKTALVQVNMVNHPLDGKVLKAELRDSGEKNQDFVVTLDGKPVTLLTRRVSYDVETMTLMLPDYAPGPVIVAFDKEADKQFHPASLLNPPLPAPAK